MTFTLTAFDEQSGINNSAIVVKQNGKDIRVLKAPNGELHGAPVVWDGRDEQGNLVPLGDYQLLFYSANRAGGFGSFSANFKVVDVLPTGGVAPMAAPLSPASPPVDAPWNVIPNPPQPTLSPSMAAIIERMYGGQASSNPSQSGSQARTSRLAGASAGVTTSHSGAVGAGIGGLLVLAAAYLLAQQATGNLSLSKMRKELSALSTLWTPSAKPAAPPVPAHVAPPLAPPPPPPSPPRPRMLRWDEIPQSAPVEPEPEPELELIGYSAPPAAPSTPQIPSSYEYYVYSSSLPKPNPQTPSSYEYYVYASSLPKTKPKPTLTPYVNPYIPADPSRPPYDPFDYDPPADPTHPTPLQVLLTPSDKELQEAWSKPLLTEEELAERNRERALAQERERALSREQERQRLHESLNNPDLSWLEKLTVAALGEATFALDAFDQKVEETTQAIADADKKVDDYFKERERRRLELAAELNKSDLSIWQKATVLTLTDLNTSLGDFDQAIGQHVRPGLTTAVERAGQDLKKYYGLAPLAPGETRDQVALRVNLGVNYLDMLTLGLFQTEAGKQMAASTLTGGLEAIDLTGHAGRMVVGMEELDPGTTRAEAFGEALYGASTIMTLGGTADIREGIEEGDPVKVAMGVLQTASMFMMIGAAGSMVKAAGGKALGLVDDIAYKEILAAAKAATTAGEAADALSGGVQTAKGVVTGNPLDIIAGLANIGMADIPTGVTKELTEEAAEKLAREAAEEVSEVVAREAAEEATERVVKEVTEEASEQVTKEAAEQTTVLIAKDAADEVEETVDDVIDEVRPGRVSNKTATGTKLGTDSETYHIGDPLGSTSTPSRSRALEDLRAELEHEGVFVWDDEDAARYLEERSRQQGTRITAVTLGDDTIVIHPDHSDNIPLLREEMCHTNQNRANVDVNLRQLGFSDKENELLREIYARMEILQNRHQWAVTPDEAKQLIRDIREMKARGEY